VWTGSRRGQGYGSVNFLGKTWRTHRLAFALAHGEIAAGMHVLHSCDNPLCVEVSHLRLGTHRENMAERSAKGRTYRRGLGTKLSVATVKEMHRAHAGGESAASIARRLGISATHAGGVLRGLFWPGLFPGKP
jgi:hypothetical protein